MWSFKGCYPLNTVETSSLVYIIIGTGRKQLSILQKPLEHKTLLFLTLVALIIQSLTAGLSSLSNYIAVGIRQRCIQTFEMLFMNYSLASTTGINVKKLSFTEHSHQTLNSQSHSYHGSSYSARMQYHSKRLWKFFVLSPIYTGSIIRTHRQSLQRVFQVCFWLRNLHDHRFIYKHSGKWIITCGLLF